MSLHMFFEHFDLLAEAPNAIPQLRALILQLAVQGKLVPQDPSDEPASMLLERISRDKTQLTIKTDQETGKQNFKIPHNWIWCKIRELGKTQTGSTPSKNNSEYFGQDIPFIKPGDISYGSIRYDNEHLSIKGASVGRLTPAQSILMVCIGGSIGKVNIVDRKVSFNQQINAISINAIIYAKLFMYFMRSSYFQNEVQSKAGQGTLPIINKSKWENIMIPLPPLAEQRRIVAKVDQLMALCDRLEARQQERRAARLAFGGAAIDRLLESRDPEELTAGVRRLLDSFNLLYDTPETVGRLRQAVLQLAVQGRLVPQDPSDEPASVLLERVRAERERMVGEKKIKKSELTPLVQESDALFILPDGWMWTRFSDVAIIASNLVQPAQYSSLPHIAPDNIEKFTSRLLQYRTIAEDGVTSPKHYFYAGQIIYSKIRPNLAKVTVVDFDGLCSADMYPINAMIDRDFLVKYMLSQPFLNVAVRRDTRVAMPKINQEELNRIPVPLPPLAEQRRIVAKVDQLMALCDELEARLKQAQADSAALLEAMVSSLLTQNSEPEPAQTA